MQSIPAIPDMLKAEDVGQARPRRLQDNLTIILFLLPALILFLLFVVYPIFQSIYYSLVQLEGLWSCG